MFLEQHIKMIYEWSCDT